MSHLSDEQIDALLREVADVDVPEPSPLFWKEFGVRVNAAIDAPSRGPRWLSPSLLGWVAAAAVLVVAVAGVYLAKTSGPGQSEPVEIATQAQVPPDTAEPAGETDAADIEADEAWAVVRSFAEELRYDDAREAGLMPRAGSVDHAATELTADERAELARLIEDELKRTGA